MGLKFDIDKAIDLYFKSGDTTPFKDSLRQVLRFAQTSPLINSVSDLSYLLATAKVESNYSLQRWESDYLCGKAGVPYKNKPCQKALEYYRSTNGKLDYYTLGTDKNGLPYFGRGLIQLTGKGNYQFYGKLLGIDLVGNADLALVPRNSFDIATTYMSQKRGGKFLKNGVKRSTFDLARDGELNLARLTIGGSGNGTNTVNRYYNIWKQILTKVKAKPTTSEMGIGAKIAITSLIVVSLSAGAYYAIKRFVK